MPRSPESTSSGGGIRRPSRRAVIIGSASIAVLAAGGATAGILSQRRPPSGPGKLVTPLLAADRFTVAHHGSELDWPEESMYAYRRSVATGVDALEVSLARTSDGVWFGLHDTTLDRTSGTKGFVASKHTWAEVQQNRVVASATSDPAQPSRPYVTFTDLMDAFATTHTLFVDPKAVDETHYDELLALIEAHVPDMRESVIAKGYCTATKWGDVARHRGLETWGFYYGAEIGSQPDLLTSTEQSWSTVGMNYTADTAAWDSIRGLGKTVIGHVLPTPASVRTSLDHGASGLMISSLKATMGHLPAAK